MNSSTNRAHFNQPHAVAAPVSGAVSVFTHTQISQPDVIVPSLRLRSRIVLLLCRSQAFQVSQAWRCSVWQATGLGMLQALRCQVLRGCLQLMAPELTCLNPRLADDSLLSCSRCCKYCGCKRTASGAYKDFSCLVLQVSSLCPCMFPCSVKGLIAQRLG